MQNAELAVVIPVYNESKSIIKLFTDWQKIFSENNIPHHFIFVNDGSTDDSLIKLNQLAFAHKNITILNQENSGHGPAILNGYKAALLYTWVFQIDSDHQYSSHPFLEMWNKKNDYNFLIAQRQDINSTLTRKIISFICSCIVKIFMSNKISDINSPYRLINASILKDFLLRIDKNTFAPNVLMSCFFIKNKALIFVTKACFRENLMPNRSKFSYKIFKGSVQTFIKILKYL
jgi:dolichol-phosphate mannosyltransferase